MRPRRVVLLAILLGLVGAVVPIAASGYMSWREALGERQRYLEKIGRQVIDRTDATIREATEALHGINTAGLPPCSPQHIDEMRRLAGRSLAVQGLSFSMNGRQVCSSWGLVTDGEVSALEPDFVTRDGVSVLTFATTPVSLGVAMIELHLGNHAVLVDPRRLVDITLEPEVRIAIADAGGTVVSVRNSPDPDLLRSLRRHPRSGLGPDYIYSAVRGTGWVAVVMEPRATLASRLWNHIPTMLIGAAMGACIVGCVIWYSRRRLSPLGELALAVHNREFIVHYQPIVQIDTGICIGAEALVRWRRPGGALVPPDQFIPLAEESGLVLPITDQVVRSVVSDLRELLAADRNMHVAINFAAADMKTGRILDVLQAELEGTDIEPSQIWLEATERGFMDVERARATMLRARALGHFVAIDDFGTGYSSLQYLQALPLDALKIDKSFIDTIGRDTATSSVTPYIIEMAKALNLCIVAEGIETQAQADYLVAHDVGFGQGWFFSKPLPAPEFMAFHRKSRCSKGSVAVPARRPDPIAPAEVQASRGSITSSTLSAGKRVTA